MALPRGQGWRKLSHTWAWALRREMARAGLKEAKKLLKVAGNHSVFELYGATRLSLSVQHPRLCGSWLSGSRGEPVRGGRLLCGGPTVSGLLVTSFHEVAVLGMSWLRDNWVPLT